MCSTALFWKEILACRVHHTQSFDWPYVVTQLINEQPVVGSGGGWTGPAGSKCAVTHQPRFWLPVHKETQHILGMYPHNPERNTTSFPKELLTQFTKKHNKLQKSVWWWGGEARSQKMVLTRKKIGETK